MGKQDSDADREAYSSLICRAAPAPAEFNSTSFKEDAAMPVLWLIVLFIVASFGIGFVFAHAGAILLILLFLRFVWWVLTDSPDE